MWLIHNNMVVFIADMSYGAQQVNKKLCISEYCGYVDKSTDMVRWITETRINTSCNNGTKTFLTIH